MAKPESIETLADATPRGCTHFKLRQAGRRVTRHYEQHLANTGLKITQYSLLSHVVKLGPLQAGELAARMQMDASTLSRNLQPLLQRGLLSKSPGTDARCREIEATAEGIAQRASAQKAWKAAQQSLSRRLGAERVAALHGLLDECLALLEEPAQEPAP